MSSEILAVSIHPSCLGLTVDLTPELLRDHSLLVARR